MTKRFTIAIEETCVEEFEVMAESQEEAIEIAEKRYRNGDIVLEPGEVRFRQMAIVAPSEVSTEWVEF